MTNATIDQDQLWSDLMTMAAIGASAHGGSQRLALSAQDKDGRALFVKWATDLGMTVVTDQIGNIMATRSGTEPDLPPVMIGSHLDTQDPGGRFDGVLGVLAGLAVVRALNAANVVLRRSIVVVDWTNEEGARFQPGLMGSGVYTGQLDLQEVLARTDMAGISVAQALTGIAGAAPAQAMPADSYLELHIEQGPDLERAGVDIGAVTDSSCMASGFITVRGENGHTQTLAMSRRRNALVGAAQIILAIEDIGAHHEPEGMVSASVVQNWPNNRVNIPHLSKLSYAVVHHSAAGRDGMIAEIDVMCREIGARTGLDITHEAMFYREALHFSDDLRARTLDIAADLGLSAVEMPTLTAHDALALHSICPVALIFVPCKDGLSHCEAEYCTPDQAAKGAEVLLRLAVERAG